MKKKLFIGFALISILFAFKAEGVPHPTTSYAPLLRYYNASAHKHLLTTDPNELGDGASGYVYEKVIGWIRKGTTGISTSNVHRFNNPSNGSHYYSLSTTAPSGYVLEGIIGNTSYAPLMYTPISISEYYNSSLQDYCYVSNATGESLTGYTLIGVAFIAATTGG